MSNKLKTSTLIATLALIGLLALTACQQKHAAPPVATVATVATPSPFKLTASVQEIMQSMIDRSADAVWDSVGTTITAKGIQDRQPRTEQEWKEARFNILTMIEATNLLVMHGRQIVPKGGKLADEGNEGVFTAAEAQQQLEAQHDTFVQFAHSLHDVGEHMLKAIDEKNPPGMMVAGTEMDEVCESCHTTFWYPHQVMPKLPADIFSQKAQPAPSLKTQE